MCVILKLLLQLISYSVERKIPKLSREFFFPLVNLQSEFQATAIAFLKYILSRELTKKMLLTYLLAAVTMSSLKSSPPIPNNSFCVRMNAYREFSPVVFMWSFSTSSPFSMQKLSSCPSDCLLLFFHEELWVICGAEKDGREDREHFFLLLAATSAAVLFI